MLVSSLAAVAGCGARGRPSPALDRPAPSAVVAAPSAPEAPRPVATPAISPPSGEDGEREERHTDAFMIRPHPVARHFDRRTYCAGGACVGLGAQLAAIGRTAKGRVAPACDDVGASACGARCESVTLGTWSAGATVTFREAGSGAQITHCHDRGGVLVGAHSDGPSGPQFGDTQACHESGAPTRALCRPGVLEPSCADGRCLAFTTMVAAVTGSAARSPDHGCGDVVTPVCGGAQPACTSVKAGACPDDQKVIVRYAGGVYQYLYSRAGALVGTDHVPSLDSYRAPHLVFGARSGTSCSQPARSLCGPP